MLSKRQIRIQEATEILNSMCKKMQIQKKLILSHDKTPDLVERRFLIARELKKHYSVMIVAEVMNRDHTTILYITDPEFRAKKMEKNRDYQRYVYKLRIA